MIYIAYDWIFKNSKFFFLFLSPSNEKSTFWWFLPYCSLACYVFLSLPLKTQIQTITRQAVILPASGMSESLLLISHIKKRIEQEEKNGMALFVTFWHQFKRTPVLSFNGLEWLEDVVINISVRNTATKNTLWDRKGTSRFGFGWFKPEATLQNYRRWSAATHDSFTLFHLGCDILHHFSTADPAHISQINSWQKCWTFISKVSMFECLHWQIGL